jgi:hypothetical protein
MEAVGFMLGSLVFLGAVTLCVARIFAANHKEAAARSEIRPEAEKKFRKAA